MRDDIVRSMQSLSPSVRPAGNGCREDSNWLRGRTFNGIAVAIRKPRGGNDWRKAFGQRLPRAQRVTDASSVVT
ncbi:MAG: hypothetical protein QM665_04475 [Desulfovibrio sp.]